jgi:hypothetical protein
MFIELKENSNFAATKAVEVAADEGPRPIAIPHEVWGAEGGGAGASANSSYIPISATALTKQTAEPTATALATVGSIAPTPRSPSGSRAASKPRGDGGALQRARFVGHRVSCRGAHPQEDKGALARAHLEHR